MKLSIVTPVYHEQANILTMLKGIAKYVKTPHETLIVYDMPEDPTYAVVAKYQHQHPEQHIRLVLNNQGNGRGFMNALKTGFLNAKGTAVLAMMADLCDDPQDIDTMYQLFVDKDADIICASRYMKGGRQIGSPIIKRTLSRLAGLSLYYLRRAPTHDITNNFKLYRTRLLHDIDMSDHGGFEIAMAITLKAHKRGYIIHELPTTWRERHAGEAKFKLHKLLPSYLKWYLYAFKR